MNECMNSVLEAQKMQLFNVITFVFIYSVFISDTHGGVHVLCSKAAKLYTKEAISN